MKYTRKQGMGLSYKVHLLLLEYLRLRLFINVLGINRIVMIINTGGIMQMMDG